MRPAFACMTRRPDLKLVHPPSDDQSRNRYAAAGRNHKPVKPRPANMFQHPQETELSPMRDKLLFIEALAASAELTGRELRVAILLTSFYSTTTGYAKPSMVRIAAALGIDKSDARKAVNSLVAKGWFFVDRGDFKLGGKGHVNHYRPNPQMVASAQPFMTASQRGADAPPFDDANPKGGKTSSKGAKHPRKGGRQHPQIRILIRILLQIRAYFLRHHVQRTADAYVQYLPPEGVIAARLKGIDKWLQPKLVSHYWTRADLKAVKAYHAFLDQVIEVYPAIDGCPIGGKAYRLVSELSWILEQNGVS